MSNNCRAIRTGGKCDCAEFVPSAGLDRGWAVCAVEGCGHTSAIHNGHKGRSSGTVSTPLSVPSTKPASAPKALSRPAEATSDGPSIADMRSWLRANGIAVGERGRIAPDLKARALAGLSQ